MADKETNTEEQIFNAASRVFQRRGFAGARMQEIADEADINKSMLHYYYRSKDKLFTEVYQQKMSLFFPVLFGVMDSDNPLDQKIEQLIDAYYSFLNDNPKMAQFVITEMNHNPERFRAFIAQRDIHPPERFYEQINNVVREGRMDEMEPEQFLVNIVSLTLFPFIATNMVQSIFDFNEQQLLKFLKDRKTLLVDFILNAINYKKI